MVLYSFVLFCLVHMFCIQKYITCPYLGDTHACTNTYTNFWMLTFFVKIPMRETQEDFYLVLFMFASLLYFYVLDPSSLLGY